MKAPNAWVAFAQSVDGELREGRGPRPVQIVVRFDEYRIIFATAVSRAAYELTYAVLPYTSIDGFHFRIRNAGFVQRVLRLLGASSVATSDPAFDREFVVRASDAAKIRFVLADARMRRLLLRQAEWGSVDFRAHAPSLFPERQELLVELDHVVRQEAALRNLYALLREALGRLRSLGSALPPP